MTPHRILLIEDNVGDIRLAVDALSRTEAAPIVDVIQTGDDAIAHLGLIRDGVAPRPALVLLDLNLPGVGGLDVLAEIRHEPALQDLVVVVLTSSNADEDIAAAYALGANDYLVKPIDPLAHDELFKVVTNFWLVRSAVPAGGG